VLEEFLEAIFWHSPNPLSWSSQKVMADMFTKSGQFVGDIKGESDKGVLRGRGMKGKFFFDPHISPVGGTGTLKIFFPNGPHRWTCSGTISAPSIERGMRGKMLSKSPNYVGSFWC